MAMFHAAHVFRPILADGTALSCALGGDAAVRVVGSTSAVVATPEAEAAVDASWVDVWLFRFRWCAVCHVSRGLPRGCYVQSVSG